MIFRYPNLANHLLTLWDRKQEWALAWRCEEPRFRGNHTNNFSEATVMIFKDVILERSKAYNAVALIDFICDPLEEHYKDRLIDFSNGRISSPYLLLEKMFQRSSYIKSAKEIGKISNCVFTVPSSNGGSPYWVDVRNGLCNCEVGSCGKYCKHQAAVVKYYSAELPNLPIMDRYEAAVLAFGDKVLRREYYSNPFDRCISSPHSSNVVNESEYGSSSEDINIGEDDQNVEMDDDVSNELDDEFSNVIAEFTSKFQAYKSDPSVQKGIRIFLNRMKKASNPSAFGSLLCSFNNQMPMKYYPGAKIRRQPTTASRLLGYGTKGRPSKNDIIRKKKRAHMLKKNVDANIPNAK